MGLCRDDTRVPIERIVGCVGFLGYDIICGYYDE